MKIEKRKYKNCINKSCIHIECVGHVGRGAKDEIVQNMTFYKLHLAVYFGKVMIHQ
jgi:hypothetical protein